jgi:hypothetical protein
MRVNERESVPWAGPTRPPNTVEYIVTQSGPSEVRNHIDSTGIVRINGVEMGTFMQRRRGGYGGKLVRYHMVVDGWEYGGYTEAEAVATYLQLKEAEFDKAPPT